MPSGHDTVAMQEFVGIEEQEGQWFAAVPGGLKQGVNRRLAGEDSKQGAVLVEAGMRLRPQDVATAAACGLDRLCCYAPLRVAILSTGDEILRPGDVFEQGKVYDANAPMLDGLISPWAPSRQLLGCSRMMRIAYGALSRMPHPVTTCS
jgi:molybdopterin molybdotransferase